MSPAGRKSQKYSQTVRVLRALDILRSRRFGIGLAEVAERLEVSERQVRRDLKVLEEAGHAIERSLHERRSWLRLDAGEQSGIRLTCRERFALLAMRSTFDMLRGTPLHEDAASIHDKILGLLSTRDQEAVADLGDRFLHRTSDGVKDFAGKDDVLDGLLTGILTRRRVDADYRPRFEPAIRGRLEAYTLILYRNGLYILGHFVDADADAPREIGVYAVERFAAAEFVRGDAFTLPADFSPTDHIASSFGIFAGDGRRRVVADFRSEIADLIAARTWHPSQQLEPLEDGGVRLSMDVSDMSQVGHWLIGWGPWVTVREPPELVERVKWEHRAAAG